MNADVAHLILAAIVVVGYIVLTALGADGNPLLGVLGGQGASRAIGAVARK